MIDIHSGMGRAEDLPAAAAALVEGETDLIAGLANLAALVPLYVERINWAGFYLLRGAELVLGPFQGRPACTRIGEGRGVCGAAVRDRRPLIVDDVHRFPGHIPCDSASNAEIVIPLFQRGEIFGVLDIDSPEFNRFSGPGAEALIKTGELISQWLSSRELC